MGAIHFTPGCRYLNDAFKVVEIEDKLDTYYKLIECDTIDITAIKIGGINVNVVVDDNGLLVSNHTVAIFNPSMNIYLVGKVVITGGVDEDGNLTSLTEEDIKTIKDTARLVRSINLKTGEGENNICLIADELE